MANSPRVPHHVTALLSHLTSRPGVQSTMILARKDGSIIQCTGELAASENLSRSNSTAIAAAEISTTQPSESSPASPDASTPAPYQPSQAETLAAHIFNFVTSASALGLTLAHPVPTQSGNGRSSSGLNGDYDGYGAGSTNTAAPREEDHDAGLDREEEDEVKLLRMRTRKHEIVVVPDRKYLLCVVHAATHSGASGSAGTRVSR
ncbi:hypothetical protein PDE_03345 [Penicillium oxalicum 114-2]|uniref:Roadblock/LAMTOR2 domain-containing protein n=1 Tax=Penicillium oxalicum (strain 114-2 / CGMCC 5302) TaxID=933388 RepID=S7ZDQ6_PENO1|nr:hypothetical protein PDE_03345 [Penicillium oxalicum 114-2]